MGLRLNYLIIFAVQFCLVSAKSWQQINTAWGKRLQAIPISYLFTFLILVDLKYIGAGVLFGEGSFWLIVLVAGTGAMLGNQFSMAIHARRGLWTQN